MILGYKDISDLLVMAFNSLPFPDSSDDAFPPVSTILRLMICGIVMLIGIDFEIVEVGDPYFCIHNIRIRVRL